MRVAQRKQGRGPAADLVSQFASSEARGDLGPLVVVDVGAEHP